MFNAKYFVTASIIMLSAFAINNESVAQENFCKTSASRVDAFSFPNRHAWNLFVMLNHPALEDEYIRGEPDCTKAFGSPGTTSVWETWRLARTEVFLTDGSEPPEWNDRSLPTGSLGETPEISDTFHSIDRLDQASFDEHDGVFLGRGGIGETRMNRSTYEFIKAQCLWNTEGLKGYAQAALSGKKPQINLPIDSIEVKAVWLEFSEESLANGIDKKYYTAEHDGKIYGLTSFHILTKDVPKWFWATFHHKDAPENEFELPDDHGQPAILENTVWENYVLGGTQIDFVDNIGRPNILSDHYIEFGFQRSSCITCHSQASASPDDTTPPRQTIDVGTPNPDAFLKDGKLFYLATDFLWSIPFRAGNAENERRRTGIDAVPLPKRCSW